MANVHWPRTTRDTGKVQERPTCNGGRRRRNDNGLVENEPPSALYVVHRENSSGRLGTFPLVSEDD